MSDYDFKTLNDKEFEVLCVDLLSEIEKNRFERFRSGKDKGVDGRYFDISGGEVVLQCKHRPSDQLKYLVAYLKKEELPKVKRLKPSRYILALSTPLSREAKRIIKEAFDPYIKNDSDIYGKEDLNHLLGLYKQIEIKHYKLWICSTNVLKHLLSHAIFDRSVFSFEEIIDSAKKYVVTDNHRKAIEKLEKSNILIITGEPGIGKTTLAEHLCVHYVSREYEFIKIISNIRDFEDVFDDNKKQIFYFDDFLGRNYLEALSGHEGSEIVSFMRRVSKNVNKKFILTSRSTIFNQGRELIDLFRVENVEKNQYELNIQGLKKIEKAMILYNHIWHSDLGVDYIEDIYKNKRYKIIIQHYNYNPRLISFLTDSSRLSACPASRYWEFIENLLSNPKDVWENPFVAQQDDFGRSIVLLVTLNRVGIQESELSVAYNRYICRPENAGMAGRKEFIYNMAHLAGSLLNRGIYKDSRKDAEINLFNPSIADFVLHRYSRDPSSLKLGFVCLRSSSSLDTIKYLNNNKIISETNAVDILNFILNEAIRCNFENYSPEYISYLSQIIISMNFVARGNYEQLSKALTFIVTSEIPSSFESCAYFYAWGIEEGLLDITDIEKFVSEISLETATDDELKQLIELFNLLPTDLSESYKEKITPFVFSHIVDDLSNQVGGSDIFDDLTPNDYDGAEESFNSLIESLIDDYGIQYSPADVNEIAGTYNIRGEFDDYCEKKYQDYEPDEYHMPTPVMVDEIDDLFDRS